MAQERLQKILAAAGVASRRAAEVLITQGKVRINGRIVTELGARADASRDRVEVDGERLVSERPVYYVLNKPREVVTTLKDPEGRPTIADLLKGVTERVFPVGRLDFHTSGVLLLTNDGELAQSLLHPTRGVPKTYVVKVQGHLGVPKLEMLRNGVVLDDGTRTGAAELFVIREEKGTTWLQITISEGKNRQIHRMCEAVGNRVMRLSRVAFAGLSAEGLRPGDYRPLTVRELAKLERDYRNPASRKRENEKRAHRHAESGFLLDGDEIAIVRAAREQRRGAAIRRANEERAEAEAAAVPQRETAFQRERGQREEAAKLDPRSRKPLPARDTRGKPPMRDARDARGKPPLRDAREGRDTRGKPPLRDARDARGKPPLRDAREGRDTRGKPPLRDARGKPPLRDARDTRGKPPLRDARDTRGKPPLRDARGKPPLRDTRGKPPLRDARDTRDARRAPPVRDAQDARRKPPVRDAQDARRKPPERDARGNRRKPPARDEKTAPRKPPARTQTRR